MVLEQQSMSDLVDAIKHLEQSFDALPEFTADAGADNDRIAEILTLVAEKMHDNYPYAHPMYAGQMIKPPHKMARLAYSLAMFVNPNNHALDGGRASSAMEKEVIKDIAAIYGWGEQHLGHLTSGGTMANLEALWVSDRIHPGKTIVASSQSHYTHSRITEVLKIPFQSVEVDDTGRMDLHDLEHKLQTYDVGTIVVTLSTTGIGAVDPLAEILELQKRYDFRIHLDAAYGGYFRLASNLPEVAQSAFALMQEADSIVVDPHKCGLQPYGCGCVLFRDPSVGQYYNHDSPYTYFSSDELHLGEISLECSRAGASAVALWATMKLLPLDRDGQFAHEIESTIVAAQQLYEKICAADDQLAIFTPQTNIVVWAPKADKASEISHMSQQRFAEAEQQGLYLATIKLPASLLKSYWQDVTFDEEYVTCLRSCLMKAEHVDWIDRIWDVYSNLA